ncbi:alpha/beta-hydrolase [Paraphaeosphaeria sporulosa]|uniref:Alpha/beta-hydrolase n=1 Tax=Paraphaeosphaeria sporulosa TaxID=1460663 RepID=A0A177CBN3_9PLEO|nr:alpha/beta-hydrolase [Paraphaeosphaeria sporulosa]OAG05103.1 alpha/beta-hydrolase [Paraphaeosphaeria sporulosa]
MACPDCFRGGVVTGDPKGTIETLYGVTTYVAKPQGTSSSPSTIVYFTDAFGLDLVNNKVLADAYASATGIRVLVPDIIPGGPMPAWVLDTMENAMGSVGLFDISGQINRILMFASLLRQFVPFMYRARPTIPATFNICLDYARKVKADLPAGGKLGLAGFCWGGYLSVNLCAQADKEGGGQRLVDASFAAHPSFLSAPGQIVDAVLKFKSPLAIAHAEKDFNLKTPAVEEAEAALRQKAGNGDGENGYSYQLTTYKGVDHGFAVRAKSGDQTAAAAADGAKEQAIEWFKKFL